MNHERKTSGASGDMTQYGGPIVRGSAGVRIGAPTGVACSVSGRDDFGQPGKSAAGGEGAARRDGPCAARPLPFILRTYSSYRTVTPAPVGVFGPAGKRLLISAYSYAMMHWYSTTTAGGDLLEPLLPGRRCTAAASQCGWCAVVRAAQPTATRWRGCGALPPDIRLSPHLYRRPTAHRAVVDTGVRAGAGC